MLQIRIQVEGVKAMDHSLGLKLTKMADLTPAWKKITKKLNAFQKSTFSKKGAGVSPGFERIAPSQPLDPWVDLKKETVAQKARLGFRSVANKPLIRTGALRDAFTKDSARGAVRKYARKAMEWGIDEGEFPYAVFHHSTKKPRTKIPRRPLLRIPDQLAKVIVQIIQTHVFKKGQSIRETL